MPETERCLDGVVIALDVDGVLLDSERGGAGPWQVALEDQFGVDPSELQGMFFDCWWPDVIVGLVSIEDALKRVIAENSWPVSVDAFLECWFAADFWPFTDVFTAAQSWSEQGARLSLVTNQEHRRAAYVKARLGELLPIDEMVYSAGVGYLKNEPEFFVIATRVLGGLSAGHPIVFIDDALPHVEVARRAGWTAVHFERGSWTERMEDALDTVATRR